MNWYSGNIGNAIGESKNKNLIFLVYSYDSKSSQPDKYWENEIVYNDCIENCVSLKLEADSEYCTQFRQIYKIDTFPTTYLIGNSGFPLEVISGQVSEDEFISRIKKAIEVHNSQKNSENKPAAAAGSSSSDKPTTSTSTEQATTSNADQAKDLDERIAQTKEKIKMIQEKKRLEEEEKQRNSEIERRKMGQEILKAKKDREDQELKKIAEQKRKEALEDQLAKQRIKEKIQQDREDRQKKYAQEKLEAEKAKENKEASAKVRQDQINEQAKAAKEAVSNSPTTRLQFRFVDGNSIVNQFNSDQTLGEVRQFIQDKLREMNDNQSFSIHSSFPKREYTSNDMNSTLRELQLTPTASLLIIPHRSQVSKKLSNLMPTVSSGSSSSGSSSGSLVSYATDLFSLAFLPFTIIYGIVASLFGFGTQNRNQPGPASSGSNQQSSQSRQSDRNPNLRQRSGNIRDLNDRDDDNATWNGNSTQQM